MSFILVEPETSNVYSGVEVPIPTLAFDTEPENGSPTTVEQDPVANIIPPKLIESFCCGAKVIFVPIIILFEPILPVPVEVDPALFPNKVE